MAAARRATGLRLRSGTESTGVVESKHQAPLVQAQSSPCGTGAGAVADPGVVGAEQPGQGAAGSSKGTGR
jgi:hypothetical protein